MLLILFELHILLLKKKCSIIHGIQFGFIEVFGLIFNVTYD